MNVRNILRYSDNVKRFEAINPKTIEDPTSKLFNQLCEKVESISFLGRGEASAVFKVTTNKSVYALKTALYPERTKKILNEAKIRQKFIDNGVQCVPAPRFADKEFFQNGAVIFDYAEGVHSDYTDENTIKNMASSLASIHKVDYEIVSDGFEQLMKNHQFLKKVMKHIELDYPHFMNPTISKAFSLALGEYESILLENKEVFPFGISGIMHGDLGGHFITDSTGKVWLIDWENSEYGDIVEEISTFILYSDINPDMRNIFFEEYKAHFTAASELNFEEIGHFYIFPVPAYNVCWGLDQLNTNLIHNLEPERKLCDTIDSAKNWSKFFSKTTSSMIVEGISELTTDLISKYNLSL